MLDTGKEIVDVGPIRVEKDVLEIVQRLHDYDPNLEILYLDPAKADFADAPYLVVENCPDGMQRKVFEVWELNEKVLERVWLADTRRGISNDVQARLDQVNKKARDNLKRRYEEQREEMKDVFSHLLGSSQHQYSFTNAAGELITMDDEYGVIKRDGKRVDGK